MHGVLLGNVTTVSAINSCPWTAAVRKNKVKVVSTSTKTTIIIIICNLSIRVRFDNYYYYESTTLRLLRAFVLSLPCGTFCILCC